MTKVEQLSELISLENGNVISDYLNDDDLIDIDTISDFVELLWGLDILDGNNHYLDEAKKYLNDNDSDYSKAIELLFENGLHSGDVFILANLLMEYRNRKNIYDLKTEIEEILIGK